MLIDHVCTMTRLMTPTEMTNKPKPYIGCEQGVEDLKTSMDGTRCSKPITAVDPCILKFDQA